MNGYTVLMTAVDTFQLTPLRSTDPNVSSFKVETLQFHVTFSNTLQSLHMNVQAVPGKTDTHTPIQHYTKTLQYI